MDTVTRTAAAGPAGPEPEPPQPVGERADCVLCSEPTEYPATTKGATLCPVCEWQQGEREAACSC